MEVCLFADSSAEQSAAVEAMQNCIAPGHQGVDALGQVKIER